MSGRPRQGAEPPDLSELRRLTWSIAYRMLGSVADAEEVVQESFLRLHRAQSDGTAIESVRAYLAVQAVRSVVNPDKLQHLGPLSDVALLAAFQ